MSGETFQSREREAALAAFVRPEDRCLEFALCCAVYVLERHAALEPDRSESLADPDAVLHEPLLTTAQSNTMIPPRYPEWQEPRQAYGEGRKPKSEIQDSEAQGPKSEAGSEPREQPLSTTKQAAFLLGWPLASNVGVGPKGVLGDLIKVGWYTNLDMHQKITPSSALQAWDAPLPDAVHSFRLGACRYLEVLGAAFEQRNLDIGSEGGFSEADRDPVMQVVSDSLKSFIRSHPDLNIYIPRGHTTLAGAPLLVEPKPCARIYAFRHLYSELPLAPYPAFTVTLCTWMVDQLPSSRTIGTFRNSHHRSEKCLPCDLNPAVAIALRTSDRAVARF
jgi:hypothetical protein